jgi:hypothetical protein
MTLSYKIIFFDPQDQPQKQETQKIIKLIYSFSHVILTAGILRKYTGSGREAA